MPLDVVVTITNQTRPLTQRGFGLPLILGTTEPPTTPDNTNKVLKNTYKLYESITDVAADYGTGTNEYKAAAAMLGQTPRPQQIAMYSVDRAETKLPTELSAVLSDICELYNDWYLLVDTAFEEAVGDTEAIADWASANGKLYICTNKAADVVVTGSTQNIAAITTRAAAIVSTRCAMIAHTDPVGAMAHAAWVGRMAPTGPGAATWKFKNLNGVPDPAFTNTAINDLHVGYVNTYVKKLGVLQTSEGLDTSGSYIDIQRSMDWLQARIEEQISFVLFNEGKIPYDDTGIAMVVNTLAGVLKQAVGNGVIAKDEAGNGMWTITAPKRAAIAKTDIANRFLPDVNFDAVIAGAIHKVAVNGILRV
jgi:hypothetical protein